jgi:hypothetical protein
MFCLFRSLQVTRLQHISMLWNFLSQQDIQPPLRTCQDKALLHSCIQQWLSLRSEPHCKTTPSVRWLNQLFLSLECYLKISSRAGNKPRCGDRLANSFSWMAFLIAFHIAHRVTKTWTNSEWFGVCGIKNNRWWDLLFDSVQYAQQALHPSVPHTTCNCTFNKRMFPWIICST